MKATEPYRLGLVGFYYFQTFSAGLVDIWVCIAATYRIKTDHYLS